MGKRLRIASLGLAISVGQLGLLGMLAHPAAAAGKTLAVQFTCKVNKINPDGSDGDDLTPTPAPTQTQSFTLNGPTEVFAHTSFDTVSPSGSHDIPAEDELTPGDPTSDVPIAEVKNISIAINVTGAAVIATPTFSGGNVLDPSASVNGGITTLEFPGTTDTPATKIPVTGPHHFTPGTPFTQPEITTHVTAGNAGTQIIATVKSLTVEARAVGINARSVCTPTAGQDVVLGVVNVVAPPPPGAPNAVSDTATTSHDQAVTIDVLKNDVKNADFDIDPSSLAVTKDPKHGQAEVNQDHTVTYTPAAGFSGLDSLDYELCSVPDTENEQPGACDTATVTVTVTPPPLRKPTPKPTTKPTTPVSTQGTTSATAAANELPRTGSSSVPLALVGFGLCGVGAGTLHAAARRRRRFEI